MVIVFGTAFDRNLSAQVAYKRFHYPQAQPRPRIQLGGEKWLEEPFAAQSSYFRLSAEIDVRRDTRGAKPALIHHHHFAEKSFHIDQRWHGCISIETKRVPRNVRIIRTGVAKMQESFRPRASPAATSQADQQDL